LPRIVCFDKKALKLILAKAENFRASGLLAAGAATNVLAGSKQPLLRLVTRWARQVKGGLMPIESVSKNIDALVPLRTLFNRAQRRNLVPAVAFAGICLLVCVSQLARGMPLLSAGQPASATTLSLAETQQIIAKKLLRN